MFIIIKVLIGTLILASEAIAGLSLDLHPQEPLKLSELILEAYETCKNKEGLKGLILHTTDEYGQYDHYRYVAYTCGDGSSGKLVYKVPVPPEEIK